MGDMYSLLLFVVMIVRSVLAVSTSVDLTGPGCDQLDGYYLKNPDDIISLFAYPQYNTIATRDHCDVTVRADLGRRIEYIIENIFFNECGVEIIMYDNPTIDTKPIYVLTCADNSKAPIQGKTNFNVLRLRVRKTTPESRAFTFGMRVKNDIGPSLDFLKDSARYTGDALEPGVIAGISTAGGVVAIALIMLAVYFCIRARNSNIKHRNYASDGSSSAYAAGRIGHPTSVKNEPEKQYLPSAIPVTRKENTEQWRAPPPQESRPPRKIRPPVPMPTQPAPRDPGRKSLSDRHRSGEHTVKPASQTRHMNKRDRETYA